MDIIPTFDAAAERAANKLTRENTRVLEALGKRIAKVRNAKRGTEHILISEATDEANMLFQHLEKVLNETVIDEAAVLERAGLSAQEQALKFFEQQGLTLLPYQKTALAENLLLSVNEITRGSFTNLANTQAIGFRFIGLDGRTTYLGFKDAYIKALDGAITEMATGAHGFSPIYRHTLNQIAYSGIRVVDFSGGWSRRLDSQVRQSILDGVRDIWQANHDRVGVEFGADGVELSAHGGCAHDHLPYQGKQFSKRDFEKLQDRLDRPIGFWNCRHIAFPIIMGISRPAHTPQELSRLRDMSVRKVEFEGRKYTAYEGTQLQRKLETAIRQAKDCSVLAASAGDDITRRAAQMRINSLTSKYTAVSKAFGLPYKSERMRVSGFRPVKAVK